jgi:hypothetical protein
VSSHTYYQHPNPEIRQDQADARRRAHRTVSTGRVHWSHEVGLHGGFVIRDRFGIDQKLSVTDAIAMHELHQAGVITRDKQGHVGLTEQKASA